ncbi:MAG: DMT family transporter [Chitinophagales bacterium]
MKEIETSKPSLSDWATLLFLSLIWGSSFILMKKGLVAFSPTQVATMRVFFTMIAMSPFIAMAFKHIRRKDLLPVAIVALMGNGIPPFLFTAAQVKLSSAAAGILNSLTPIFVFLFGVLFFKMTFKLNRLLGVGLGFVGAVSLILFAAPQSLTGESEYIYGLYIVGASLCYSISANTVKSYCQNIHPIALNMGVFLIVGPFAGLYLFSTDFLQVLQTHPEAWSSFGYIIILAIFGTAIATILFFKLTQKTDALFSSTVTYLIPIFALFWGFLDGEMIGWSYLVGLTCILSGVYLAGK